MKPTSMDHRQVNTNLSEAHRIAQLVNDNGGDASVPPFGAELRVRTIEGQNFAKPGDWIVKVSRGKFLVRKDGI